MTIREKMFSMLTENGMFERDANSVLTDFESNSSNADIVERWNEDESGYPAVLILVVWASVKMSAFDWLKKNLPKAWFLPMFES